MVVYFVGVHGDRVGADGRGIPLLHLPDHRVLPRLGPAAVAGRDRRRVRHVGPGQHGDRRVPDEPRVVDDLRGDHRHPDARDRRSAWCSARGWPSRASSGAWPWRGSRRRSRRMPGCTPSSLTQAREAGVLDERQRMAREIHDTIAQGLTGDRHPARGGRAGRRPAGASGSVTSGTRSASPARACRRRGDRSRASRPEHLETARLPDALADGRAAAGRSSTASPSRWRRPATSSRSTPRSRWRCCERRRRRWPTSPSTPTPRAPADAVVHGRRRDARRPRRRRRVHGPRAIGRRRGDGFGLSAMRQRVNRVAGTLAIESEPGGGTAISARVPAIVAPGWPAAP